MITDNRPVYQASVRSTNGGGVSMTAGRALASSEVTLDDDHHPFAKGAVDGKSPP
jgi:hypothetical protein